MRKLLLWYHYSSTCIHVNKFCGKLLLRLKTVWVFLVFSDFCCALNCFCLYVSYLIHYLHFSLFQYTFNICFIHVLIKIYAAEAGSGKCKCISLSFRFANCIYVIKHPYLWDQWSVQLYGKTRCSTSLFLVLLLLCQNTGLLNWY